MILGKKTTFVKTICYTIVVVLCFIAIVPSVAIANPDDAVAPNENGTVIVGTATQSTTREPDDNHKGLLAEQQVRDEQGIVSQLSTTTHNPYNGQIRLDIDVGSEFATFEGSDFTEGIRVKVSPGGTVQLPKVKAREGYYFIGWGQGGVPYEPTWDIFTTEVEMDTDTSNGKNTTIFALYADEEGNGYCTCGAYESGVYTDKMEEIKALNKEYNEQNQLEQQTLSADFVLWLLIGLVVCWAMFTFCTQTIGSDR